MAKTIDIELQKQLDKPQAWFCKYFPARIRNVSEREIADRKLVFDFKDGRAYEEVAQRTAANMTERYGTSCTTLYFLPYWHPPIRRTRYVTKHSAKEYAN